jgi:GTP cyclohydrolase I
MNAALPDVSLTNIVPSPSPLAWVGMQGINLSITVVESRYKRDFRAGAPKRCLN